MIYGQDTCFTKKQTVTIANNIKVLQNRDSLNNLIIGEQDSVIGSYKTLKVKDDLIISGQDSVITIYKQNDELYKGVIRDYKQLTFLEKAKGFAIGGMAGMIITMALLTL